MGDIADIIGAPSETVKSRLRYARRQLREQLGWVNRGSHAAVRVHDLRHTFGHRLRAAGVSFEDRQDLLGHRSGRITTHYSAPDLQRLLRAVDAICERADVRKGTFYHFFKSKAALAMAAMELVGLTPKAVTKTLPSTM